MSRPRSKRNSVRSIIADSGALVAMFDKLDRHRERIVKALNLAGGPPLITTWPCVTEATHVLGRIDMQVALLTFIRRGGALVFDFAALELEQFEQWMVKYSDRRRRMDFADASLIWLAVEARTHEILTTDLNDFERYRLPGGKRFEIL